MDRVDTSLKDTTQEFSLAKLKSDAVVAAVLFIIFGLLNSPRPHVEWSSGWKSM
jgi:calcium load-activated calcium channel